MDGEASDCKAKEEVCRACLALFSRKLPYPDGLRRRWEVRNPSYEDKWGICLRHDFYHQLKYYDYSRQEVAMNWRALMSMMIWEAERLSKIVQGPIKWS